MKAIFFVLIAVAISFTACQKSTISSNTAAEEIAARRGADDPVLPPPSNLPPAVLNAFTAAHPTATRMEWQAEDNNTWKVKYFIGNERWRALYAADGTLIWDRRD
jgi:hypothetical protein